MLSAETVQSTLVASETRDRSALGADVERLLEASMARSLPMICLGLGLFYSVLAPLRWVVMPGPYGRSLGLIALLLAFSFAASFLDLRRRRLSDSRAVRLVGFCGLLVITDFLFSVATVPAGNDVTTLCVILVSCGFLVLSTSQLLGLFGVAIIGFWLARTFGPADAAALGWPLAVLPAAMVAMVAHYARIGAIESRARLVATARRAEASASAAMQRLQAATRSQQRLRDVLEASPDIVRIVGGDGAILYENGASRRLLAAAPAVAVGDPAQALGHYPDRFARRVLEEVVPRVQRDGVWTGESAVRMADGNEVPMSQVVLAHKNGRGQIEAYSTVMRDLSDQKASENDLRRELRVSDTLARIGRELLETRGTVPLLDRACHIACEILGCDSTQTFLFEENRDTYMPIAGIGDPSDQWECLTNLRLPRVWMPGLLARLRREKWLDLRVGLKTSNGLGLEDLIGKDRTEARQLVVRLRAAGIRRIGLLALWRDERMIGFQTACYRSEAAPGRDQVKMAKGFAHLVSLALENARLVRELEHVNALKSDFVSTVSHELRSPLNIILGYVDLMRDGSFGDVSEEQVDTLERIERQGQQLLEHINETLDFGRLEAGRTVLETSELTVEEVLWEIDAEARPLIEQREPDVKVRIAAAEDLPLLMTDREKLKVVLKNLLGNALKFTRSGRVEIGATARNAGVEFSVRDTGCGISSADLRVVFEPFRQLAATPTNGAKGVGLGLNIAQRFVSLLGGTIEVESEVGRGTTFRVWIPSGTRTGAAEAA